MTALPSAEWPTGKAGDDHTADTRAWLKAAGANTYCDPIDEPTGELPIVEHPTAELPVINDSAESERTIIVLGSPDLAIGGTSRAVRIIRPDSTGVIQ